ncbi:hypothetical protein QBC47DRAFT_436900 [Echria macrotheca]|uniref:Uncharacterized protein n=1 Tax=Echria macrotheca TaxID=438768 RepID=A0AAJ0BJ57_9PEZI|nr:hypothetical protein QBC47DRAFT_436900 [Echria macrotheca]
MQVYTNVKRIYSSLQDRVGFRRRKDLKRLQILSLREFLEESAIPLTPKQSQPFDFKKEATILPGYTEDELSVLREKAAASRIGIADETMLLFPSSPSRDSSPDYMHPRHAPSVPRDDEDELETPALPVTAFETQLLLSNTLTGGSTSSSGRSTPMDLDFGSPVSPMSVSMSVRRPGSPRGSLSGRSGRGTRATRSKSA